MSFLQVSLLLCAFTVVYAQVPSYIHVCRRSDPKVEDCVIKSIEELRPRLKYGIPELQVPSIEPLYIKEVEIANGKDASKLRIYGRDLYVRDASNFTINKLKVDTSQVNRLVVHVDLGIPKLNLDGDYDLSAKIIVLPIVGRGKIYVNVTDAHADAVVYAQIYKKGNKSYLRFNQVEMTLDIDNFDIRLANLFNGDPTLSEVANRVIRENKGEIKNTLNPIVSRTVSKVLLEIANKITTNNSYDDLFPM